jgi:hypothetical protein
MPLTMGPLRPSSKLTGRSTNGSMMLNVEPWPGALDTAIKILAKPFSLAELNETIRFYKNNPAVDSDSAPIESE